MPVEVLYVGPLSNATDTDPAAAYDVPSSPVIVGPEPILSDGSNATYGEMRDDFTISSGSVRTESRIDYVKGKLDVLSVDSTRATLNTVRLVGVGSGTTWNTTTAPAISADLYDPTSWSSTYGWQAMWQDADRMDPSNSGDVTYLPGDWGSTFRHPSTGLNFTAAEVLDFLASGNAHMRCQTVGNQSTSGTFSVTGRLYEFRVEVDYTLIVSNPPQLRKYPNPTGLGVGPARHWPRPRRGITGIR